MDRTTENALLLARCRLFLSLDSGDRQILAARAHRKRFARGVTNFRVGDPGDTLMVVAAGSVRISLPSVNGRDIILSNLGLGEVFGEVAVFDGNGRSADAISLAETDLLVLHRGDLLRFLAARPDFALRLLALLSARLRNSDERMADLASNELSARLAKAILRLAPTAGASLAITQRDLAGIVVGSREAVNRHLAAWQRTGIVTMRGGVIVVQRPTELAEFAGMS